MFGLKSLRSSLKKLVARYKPSGLPAKTRIKERRGEKQETLSSEGRPYSQEDLDAYKKAKTQLGLGDWMRSREIASFFFKHGFALPDNDDRITPGPSRPPQHIYLARGRGAPAPLVSHSRQVTAARSSRWASSSVFRTWQRRHRNSAPDSAPQSKFRSPAVRNSAPLFRTQRKFRTHSAPCFAFRVGYWEPGEIRLAPQCGQNSMLKGASSERNSSDPCFCRHLYLLD